MVFPARRAGHVVDRVLAISASLMVERLTGNRKPKTQPRIEPYGGERIASLLASSTEIVCSLGLRERLVGVSGVGCGKV